MKLNHIFGALLLTFALLSGLAGCGGGANSASIPLRSVTITLEWPAKAVARAGMSPRNSGGTRVLPGAGGTVTAPASVMVEVYDGVKRVALLTFNGSTTPAQTVALPAKALTFYANAFTSSQPFDPATYITNPATGKLGKLSGSGIVPLTTTDNHPVASAVTAQDVSSNTSLTFTLDNTIVSIELAGQDPTTAPATTLSASAPLDAGTLYLNNLVRARAVDGAVVLVDPKALSWAIDSKDSLGKQRAGVVPDATDTVGSTLTLKNTGLVHLIVTDSEVNAGQTVITANIDFTILPPTLTANTPKTITIPAGATSKLIGSLPAYARSVTYTLSATPLIDTINTPPVLDTPPANGGLTAAATTYTVNVAFGPTTLTLKNGSSTVNSIPLSFTPGGRPLTLTVNAWSNADGTGELLAQGAIYSLVGDLTAPANLSQEVALTSNVTGFSLTPPNPTITLVNPGTSSLNSVALTTTAVINSNTPGFAVDPRTVTATSSDSTVATISIQQDVTAGTWYLLVTARRSGTVTITVTDAQGHTGTTKVTVVNSVAGGGLNIN